MQQHFQRVSFSFVELNMRRWINTKNQAGELESSQDQQSLAYGWSQNDEIPWIQVSNTLNPSISSKFHPCCWVTNRSDAAAMQPHSISIHPHSSRENYRNARFQPFFLPLAKNASGNVFSCRNCQGDWVKLKKNSHVPQKWQIFY